MSVKNCDNHNRFRDKTVSFRVSSEEDKQINIAVALSGMNKQDYIVAKLLDRTILVQGNCKIHRAVYDTLNGLLAELQRINDSENISAELLSNIELVSVIIDKLYIKTSV